MVAITSSTVPIHVWTLLAGNLLLLLTAGIATSYIIRARRRLRRLKRLHRDDKTLEHSLLNATFDHAVIIGTDGRILDTNDAAALHFGKLRADLHGSDFYKRFSPLMGGALKEHVANAVRNKKVVREREEDASGRYEFIFYPVPSEADVTKLAIFWHTRPPDRATVCEEISGKYEVLFETSRDTIMTMFDNRFTDCNSATAELFGYSKEEIVGMHPSELSPPVQPDGQPSNVKAEAMMKHAMEHGSNFFEWQHLKKDGSRFWAEVLLSRFDLDGQQMLQVVLRDITKRKCVDSAIAESERKLKGILDHSHELMGLLDTDGKLIEVNRAALDILNLKEEDVIGKPFVDTPWWNHSEEQRERLREAIEKARSGEFVRFPTKLFNPNGKVHDIDFSIKPILDETGAPIYLVPEGWDVSDLKTAQQALTESEAQRDLVLSSLPMAFYAAYPYGDYGGTWVSTQIQGLSGFEPKAFTDNPGLWAERLHPDDREAALAAFEKLPETERLKLEYRWQHMDGSYRWLQDYAVLIRDEEGAPKEVVGTWMDITARKQTEAALFESEQRFRLLAENAKDIVSLLHLEPSPHYVYVSPSVEKILGYTPQEHYDEAALWSRCVLPEDKHILEKLVGSEAEFDNPVTIRFERKDGEQIWMELRTTPQHGPDGKLVALESIGRDVSDRVLATQQIAEQEARFRSITQNLTLGLCIIDQDMRIVDFNPRMRDWFPELDKNGSSQCITICQSKSDSGCAICPNRQTFQDGKTHELTREVETTAGVRELRILACPLYDSAGIVTHVIELLEDVTDKVRIQNQMHQVQKLQALGTLSGGIAHEINQPLSAIKLTSGILQRVLDKAEFEGKEGIVRRVDRIANCCDEIDNIVQHIRKLIRTGENSAPQTLNMNDEVQDAIYLMRAQLEAHSIALDLVHEQPDITIEVPSTQFQQVVSNLVVNARQALDAANTKKKTIAVKTQITGSSAVLSVEDNGPGFEEHLEQVFDPFFTTKDPGEGMGLGLSLSHTFVTSWGGEITVGSSSMGGAKVVVRIPLKKGDGVDECISL